MQSALRVAAAAATRPSHTCCRGLPVHSRGNLLPLFHNRRPPTQRRRPQPTRAQNGLSTTNRPLELTVLASTAFSTWPQQHTWWSDRRLRLVLKTPIRSETACGTSDPQRPQCIRFLVRVCRAASHEDQPVARSDAAMAAPACQGCALRRSSTCRTQQHCEDLYVLTVVRAQNMYAIAQPADALTQHGPARGHGVKDCQLLIAMDQVSRAAPAEQYQIPSQRRQAVVRTRRRRRRSLGQTQRPHHASAAQKPRSARCR